MHLAWDVMLKKSMKAYELSYIVSPEITSEEAEAKGKEIENAITSREGTIVKQSNPIARTLSYQIAKRASGYFGVIEFQIEAEKLLEVKEIVAKDKKIVRHMLLIKEAAEMKKERRTRTKPVAVVEEQKIEAEKPEIVEETESEKEEKPSKVKVEKEKVELKDIEEKLEELLGE
jgi:ribosomal protein S6